VRALKKKGREIGAKRWGVGYYYEKGSEWGLVKGVGERRKWGGMRMRWERFESRMKARQQRDGEI